MWKFKPFMQKEQTGLEGRVIDIGNYKVQVRNAIAEGGFSCVYLARDAIHGSKQFALKHIVCNDHESEELVMKEISVMKTLKGHPNVVSLFSNAIFDMGRTKEALLLMEYCEKSLVNVLESRGAGFFDEKQALTIFRDICNAVFAMHCQVPPIAHRDLKAENLLLGSDGLWKLCDFGSATTNHKRFEKPEEMGIEEDNIRKHTTPAYRAPEMWDLFRRELINEKVDIWALGCLLFRICYFKSAFDGESKLQILNGNYRIPDLPKYNALLIDLLKDMLQSSPDDRPDITQVWFRVNELLPDGLQKSLPDRPPEMLQNVPDVLTGTPKPMPRRTPPPPSSTPEAHQNMSSTSKSSRHESSGALGSFWNTQHAKGSEAREGRSRPKYDDDTTEQKSFVNENWPDKQPVNYATSKNVQNFQSPHVQRNVQERSVSRPSDFFPKDTNLFPDDSDHNVETLKQLRSEVTPTFQNDAYNAFVVEFDVNKRTASNNQQKAEDKLEGEVAMLKEQLARVNVEKAEITSKYEKLTAICRSQRQEIQDLKQALAARTHSPSRDSSRNAALTGSKSSSSTAPNEVEGTIWELQQGFFDQNSSSSDSKHWQAFTDELKPPTNVIPTNNAPKSVRTLRNSPQKKQVAGGTSGANPWGFETDAFKVVPNSGPNINNIPAVEEINNSQLFGESRSVESKLGSQPSGWAGF